MFFPRKGLMGIAGVILAMMSPASAGAQLVQLTSQVRPELYDDLERAAAVANESAFRALQPICGGGVGGACTVARNGVFQEVRELVDTAADILAPGSGAFSLGLDNEGLGNALRWTAAEEVQAKSRAAANFSNGQLSSVNNRVTAIRYGATGFSIAGLEGLPTKDFPNLPEAASLGAAGASQTLSKLGGFVNGAYGWGLHDPTTFEDAFDYQSIDVTFGADYRIVPALVLGLVGGYSQGLVDFDGSKSVVDGEINSDGFSLGTFGLYTLKSFFVSGFFSYQRMSFDVDRFITYPSLNPNVAGVNTRTKGKTNSNAYTVSGTTGYTYRFGPGSSKMFLIEPSARVQYSHITIDEYSEKDVSSSEYFALRIAEQKVESLKLSLGIRTSAAISTPVGVFFPYVRVKWHFEFKDGNRETTSQYDSLGGLGIAVPFALKSEKIDTDFGTVSAGVQTILYGGRQRDLGGSVTDRISVFVEYRTVVQLENIENQVINGGLRYTF